MSQIRKKSFVYLISSIQTELIYIGSTTYDLQKRLKEHFFNYKRYLEGNYKYMTSFEIVKYNDAKINILIEGDYTRKELHILEGSEMLKNDKCVNKYVAGRTQYERRHLDWENFSKHSKEYYQNNKEKISQYHKDYRKLNSDKVKQRKIKYNDKNKEKINKHKKEYYELNKEAINQKKKEYNEINKNTIYEKFNCVCGGKYTRNQKSIHLKTKKHKKYLTQIENII